MHSLAETVRRTVIEASANVLINGIPRFSFFRCNVDIAVVHENMVELKYLRAYQSGRGDGNTAMQALCILLDRYDVNCLLLAFPMPANYSRCLENRYCMTDEQLVKWYEQFGFKERTSGGRYMDRRCKNG